MELGALHHARGLVAHAAEQQRGASVVQRVRQMLERVQASAIDGGHVCVASGDDSRY